MSRFEKIREQLEELKAPAPQKPASPTPAQPAPTRDLGGLADQLRGAPAPVENPIAQQLAALEQEIDNALDNDPLSTESIGATVGLLEYVFSGLKRAAQNNGELKGAVGKAIVMSGTVGENLESWCSKGISLKRKLDEILYSNDIAEKRNRIVDKLDILERIYCTLKIANDELKEMLNTIQGNYEADVPVKTAFVLKRIATITEKLRQCTATLPYLSSPEQDVPNGTPSLTPTPTAVSQKTRAKLGGSLARVGGVTLVALAALLMVKECSKGGDLQMGVGMSGCGATDSGDDAAPDGDDSTGDDDDSTVVEPQKPDCPLPTDFEWTEHPDLPGRVSGRTTGYSRYTSYSTEGWEFKIPQSDTEHVLRVVCPAGRSTFTYVTGNDNKAEVKQKDFTFKEN